MDKLIHSTTHQSKDAEELFLGRVVAALNSSLSELSRHETDRLNQARRSAITQKMEGAVRKFTGSAPALPPAVTTRLDAIRVEALQRAQTQLSLGDRPSSLFSRAFGGYGMPISAFASVCVLITTLAVFKVRDNMPDNLDPIPLVVMEDSVLLVSEEDIELYENLEFYQWLAENGLQY